MRQRLLSTMLTCLAVMLAVALGISIAVIRTEGRSVLAQSDYGFDALVGPKGSGFDLVMNTIYHLGKSQGNIPYGLYEDMASGVPESAMEPGKPNQFRGLVQWAVPFAVGDSYQGRRIVGTTGRSYLGRMGRGMRCRRGRCRRCGVGSGMRWRRGGCLMIGRLRR